MSTIQEQLKNLEKQKEELEKRIQEEKEQKRLSKMGLSYLKQLNDNGNEYIKTSGRWKRKQHCIDVRTKRMIIFCTGEKFETLYEIIKKQDERIKTLENFIFKNQILNQDV